jgi:isocitrate dehydrogenase kinase/phosphatase
LSTRPRPAEPATDPLAETIIGGYHDYRRRFGEITRRAVTRFEERDWEEGQEDARDRILVYDVVVHETLSAIRQRLGDGPPPGDPAGTRQRFAEWARSRPDCEIAETFYNSVIRRLYGTVGVDPTAEFVGEDVDDPPGDGRSPTSRFSLADGFAAALRELLDSLPFHAPWHERDRRIRQAAHRLQDDMGPESEWRSGTLEILDPIFFRNKAAYIVGRFTRDHDLVPVVLSLLHPQQGITLDAVLTTFDEASVVFGFTRSYLHAAVGAPRPTIEFLRSIMPLKRIDELYTAIGFNRHGKTEFYRTLRGHLTEPEVRFEFTPGKEGLVMIVFTLAGLNVVFKVIRDQFGHPKKTTPERVKRN